MPIGSAHPGLHGRTEELSSLSSLNKKIIYIYNHRHGSEDPVSTWHFTTVYNSRIQQAGRLKDQSTPGNTVSKRKKKVKGQKR